MNTANNIENYKNITNKLQQSSLYIKLLRKPDSWIEVKDYDDVNMAYILETYGLINVLENENPQTIKAKISHII